MNEMTVYPACFLKEENGFSVIFPDLDNLATCGTNLNDAMAMAVDCLAGYIEWNEEDGDKIPEPSKIEDIDLQKIGEKVYNDGVPEGSFVSLVSVNVKEYAEKHFNKARKKTVTIPVWLDMKAKAAGLNFSKLLQKAICSELGINFEKSTPDCSGAKRS